MAGGALRDFIGYETPFVFPAIEARTGEAMSRQVVLVLVDGLGLTPSRALPFLNELRGRGADYDCRIGEPSLSLPGRAVIASGAWQEINGQLTNYNPRPLRVEHVFSVVRRRDLGTALAAGRNGVTLFAPAIGRAVVYANDPETAPFATYEAAQKKQATLAGALLAELRGQRGLVMLELHAVDEAGHGWGASSDEYRRAAAEADDAIRGFASQLDLSHDTLVVTADHGHVAAGGHGGPEEDVMHVPLVLAGAGARPSAKGACRQIDIASTLCVLLGTAVPSSNQGRPLLDALVADSGARVRALQAVLAQREAFVARYVYKMATLGDPTAPAGVLPDPDAPIKPPVAGEDWQRSRLDALDRREAAARQARQTLETEARARPAVLVVVAPVALAILLVALGVVGGAELGRAALAAALGLVLYWIALPAVGLRYSLSAVNKDEWLPAFFRKDMIIGLAACAIAIALGAWRERGRTGVRRFDLARFAWLVAAVFSWAFAAKAAAVYWEQGVSTGWQVGDMRLGLGFYFDVLVVMAVGLASPLLFLPAWLALRRGRGKGPPNVV